MKIKKIKIFVITTLLVGLILMAINFISGYFSQRVKIYIKQKVQLEASNLISTTIKTEVLPHIDLDNMVKIIGEENKIESVFINTYQVNKITSEISENLGNMMRNINERDFDNLYLPMGIILSDTLFSNLGPNINIRIYPVGSIIVDILSDCEHYGINNSLLTIYVKVRIIFAAVIPFQRSEVEVQAHLPLIVQIIQGVVPRYYFNSSSDEYIPYPIIE